MQRPMARHIPADTSRNARPLFMILDQPTGREWRQIRRQWIYGAELYPFSGRLLAAASGGATKTAVFWRALHLGSLIKIAAALPALDTVTLTSIKLWADIRPVTHGSAD